MYRLTTVAFNVQLLNAASFRAVTGHEPPSTPVSAETYKASGYPFFDMYEEPSDIHGDFEGVKSVAQLERREETHHNFPIKTIRSISGATSAEGKCSLVNPKGPFMPTFRHITELEAMVRKLRLNK